MFGRCKHYWEDVFADYQNPNKKVKVWGDDPFYHDMADRLMFGVTWVQQKCTKCGNIKTVEVRGKYTLGEK